MSTVSATATVSSNRSDLRRSVELGPDGMERLTPWVLCKLAEKRSDRCYHMVINQSQISRLVDGAFDNAVLDGIPHLESAEQCRGLMHYVGSIAKRFGKNRKGAHVKQAPMTRYFLHFARAEMERELHNVLEANGLNTKLPYAYILWSKKLQYYIERDQLEHGYERCRKYDDKEKTCERMHKIMLPVLARELPMTETRWNRVHELFRHHGKNYGKFYTPDEDISPSDSPAKQHKHIPKTPLGVKKFGQVMNAAKKQYYPGVPVFSFTGGGAEEENWDQKKPAEQQPKKVRTTPSRWSPAVEPSIGVGLGVAAYHPAQEQTPRRTVQVYDDYQPTPSIQVTYHPGDDPFRQDEIVVPRPVEQRPKVQPMRGGLPVSGHNSVKSGFSPPPYRPTKYNQALEMQRESSRYRAAPAVDDRGRRVIEVVDEVERREKERGKQKQIREQKDIQQRLRGSNETYRRVITQTVENFEPAAGLVIPSPQVLAYSGEKISEIRKVLPFVPNPVRQVVLQVEERADARRAVERDAQRFRSPTSRQLSSLPRRPRTPDPFDLSFQPPPGPRSPRPERRSDKKRRTDSSRDRREEREPEQPLKKKGKESKAERDIRQRKEKEDHAEKRRQERKAAEIERCLRVQKEKEEKKKKEEEEAARAAKKKAEDDKKKLPLIPDSELGWSPGGEAAIDFNENDGLPALGSLPQGPADVNQWIDTNPGPSGSGVQGPSGPDVQGPSGAHQLSNSPSTVSIPPEPQSSPSPPQLQSGGQVQPNNTPSRVSTRQQQQQQSPAVATPAATVPGSERTLRSAKVVLEKLVLEKQQQKKGKVPSEEEEEIGGKTYRRIKSGKRPLASESEDSSSPKRKQLSPERPKTRSKPSPILPPKSPPKKKTTASSTVTTAKVPVTSTSTITADPTDTADKPIDESEENMGEASGGAYQPGDASGESGDHEVIDISSGASFNMSPLKEVRPAAAVKPSPPRNMGREIQKKCTNPADLLLSVQPQGIPILMAVNMSKDTPASTVGVEKTVTSPVTVTSVISPAKDTVVTSTPRAGISSIESTPKSSGRQVHYSPAVGGEDTVEEEQTVEEQQLQAQQAARIVKLENELRLSNPLDRKFVFPGEQIPFTPEFIIDKTGRKIRVPKTGFLCVGQNGVYQLPATNPRPDVFYNPPERMPADERGNYWAKLNSRYFVGVKPVTGQLATIATDGEDVLVVSRGGQVWPKDINKMEIREEKLALKLEQQRNRTRWRKFLWNTALEKGSGAYPDIDIEEGPPVIVDAAIAAEADHDELRYQDYLAMLHAERTNPTNAPMGADETTEEESSDEDEEIEVEEVPSHAEQRRKKKSGQEGSNVVEEEKMDTEDQGKPSDEL